MRTRISRTFMMMLTATMVWSCDMAIDSNSPENGCKVIVTGSVSDIDSNEPLKGIKVSFRAYSQDGSQSSPLLTQTVYSDSNGIYAIETDSITDAVKCRISAESPDPKKLPYFPAIQEVNINWKGNGYDDRQNSLFVNNCDFKLSKRQ